MSGKPYVICGFWEGKGSTFLKHSEIFKIQVEFYRCAAAL